MRIALVTVEYVTEPNFAGGLANYVHKVAHGLRELGHEPEIFLLCERSEVFTHEGVRIERCPPQKNWNTRFFDWKQRRFNGSAQYQEVVVRESCWGLECAVRARHAEHAFDLVQYTQLMGTAAYANRAIPTVLRLSNTRELWIPYGCVFSEHDMNTERRSMQRAHAVFSPSYWVSSYVEKTRGRPTAVIPSPFVPTAGEEDASVLENELKGIGPYAVYFGSLAVWKGVYLLAEVLRDFLQAHPDRHFVFIGRDLQGDPDNPPWERIQDLVGDAADRVHRLQALPHGQLFPVLHGADYVVLPSFADNFPNTLPEAMSLGKIVIGTRGRSFEQMITDGENGFLCEPGDKETLRDAMERVEALEPETAAEIGRRAGEQVDTLLPENIVNELVSFYEEVIAAHPRNWRPVVS